MEAASRHKATRRIVSDESHTKAPFPSWSVFERASLLPFNLFERDRRQFRHPQTGIIAQRQDCRIAQSHDIAPTGIKHDRKREPLDRLRPDSVAEPQGAGLALPDPGPAPQATKGIADHPGTDEIGNTQKVMGHRQRRQAPGHGGRLELTRLAIVDIGHEPSFAGGQTDPALPCRKVRVAIQVDRERLDAGGRPRLETLLEIEFDQTSAFTRQFLEQGDELGFAIPRGPGTPTGQFGLARRQDRHDLPGNRRLRLCQARRRRRHRQI